MSYGSEAQAIREQFVPEEGQAATIQGELICSLDALRADGDGTRHDGRREDYALMVGFLREILCGGEMFERPIADQLDRDLDAIADDRRDGIDPLAYDRVTERIVDWARLHPELMPHHPNPALTI